MRGLLKAERLKNGKNGVRNVKSNSIGLFGNRQSRATAERLDITAMTPRAGGFSSGFQIEPMIMTPACGPQKTVAGAT